MPVSVSHRAAFAVKERRVTQSQIVSVSATDTGTWVPHTEYLSLSLSLSFSSSSEVFVVLTYPSTITAFTPTAKHFDMDLFNICRSMHFQ